MIHECCNVQDVRKKMRDVPVVAGGTWRGAAGLSTLLRESRGRARAVHGVERSIAYARDHLSEMGEVGEDLMVCAMIIAML